MKKIITLSFVVGTLALNAQSPANSFGPSIGEEIDNKPMYGHNTDAQPADANPGDPEGLPINDYTYVLFAAGAALAAYAARKKKMAI